jgi:hypothetical protein
VVHRREQQPIHLYDFFYLVCEAIGTAATSGLLCQPRVIVKMIVEKQMECRLEGETEVLGENLPQRHFCPSQFTYMIRIPVSVLGGLGMYYILDEWYF